MPDKRQPPRRPLRSRIARGPREPRALGPASKPNDPAHPRIKRVTLDRLLSKLGIASRNKAQEWIRAGRLAVNRRVVRNPDTWIVWPDETVTLDDRPLRAPSKRIVLFHKPKGIVTTRCDEQGRKTIFDLLPEELTSLQAVGRLDQATSGLLLLTNDTTFSNRLTDPSNHVPRVYLVTVRGKVSDEALGRATAGVTDSGERLQCIAVTLQKRSWRESHLEVTLTEGKNREIRRLFKALGHEVTRLRRIRFGPFAIGDLPPGAWRDISVDDACRRIEDCRRPVVSHDA